MGARFARIAAIGALVGALGLAGCGRKAGLDPPPQAAVTEPAGATDSQSGNGGIGRNGKPVAPSHTERKSFLLDWLID